MRNGPAVNRIDTPGLLPLGGSVETRLAMQSLLRFTAVVGAQRYPDPIVAAATPATRRAQMLDPLVGQLSSGCPNFV
jgi:hypothetical protein